MATALIEMRKLLATQLPVQSGVVAEVTQQSILVRSPGGLREFVPADPSLYKVGASVRFQGELLIGLSPGRSGLPVYSV